MMFDMLEFYNTIKKLNINIIYCGPIWADGVEGLGGTLRKRLEFDELPLAASQSVFSVFVEQMNNMLMYSAETEGFATLPAKNLDVSKGLFVMGVQDKTYFIQSGNLIKNESIDILTERIDYLNTLDKAGLRKFYKEQIKNEKTNLASKGAGLGLIEIARRASSKIEYQFTPSGEGTSFFTICVKIGTKEG